MDRKTSPLVSFFTVIAKERTYLNLIYLLLAFPLGMFYFIFLVFGLTLGTALLLLLVGLLILMFVALSWWGFILLERALAENLLREPMYPLHTRSLKGKTTWEQIVAYAANPVTWKGLLYLFIKFPLGVLSFFVTVGFGVTTLGLLAAPALYRFIELEMSLFWGYGWRIDTLSEAILAFFIGVVLAFVSLHVFNGLAWISGKFAALMLGNPGAAGLPTTQPVPSGAPVPPQPAQPAAPPETPLPAPPLPPTDTEETAGNQAAEASEEPSESQPPAGSEPGETPADDLEEPAG